jgi:hypothetical protein
VTVPLPLGGGFRIGIGRKTPCPKRIVLMDIGLRCRTRVDSENQSSAKRQRKQNDINAEVPCDRQTLSISTWQRPCIVPDSFSSGSGRRPCLAFKPTREVTFGRNLADLAELDEQPLCTSGTYRIMVAQEIFERLEKEKSDSLLH